mmetsp:Transcript_11724/g.20403  ORF Transcript_11724/g.20403 Transcript_11724/m.20403 type:complete len:92 (-) Transcript_11724:434-709(-)
MRARAASRACSCSLEWDCRELPCQVVGHCVVGRAEWCVSSRKAPSMVLGESIDVLSTLRVDVLVMHQLILRCDVSTLDRPKYQIENGYFYH